MQTYDMWRTQTFSEPQLIEKKKKQHILKTNFALNEKVSEALSFEEPLCLRLQMMTSCTNSS